MSLFQEYLIGVLATVALAVGSMSLCYVLAALVCSIKDGCIS